MNYKIIYAQSKRYWKFIPYIVIVLLVLYMRGCTTDNHKIPKTENTFTTDTIIYIDTITITGQDHYYPAPYQTIDTFYKDVHLEKQDSARIIAEFAKLKKYNLPVMDDSNGKLNVFADVQFNSISKWTFEAQFFQKSTIIEKNHVIIVKPRTKVFVGVNAGILIPETDLILAPSVALLTKKDHLYTLQYDPFHKAAQIGGYWKLKIKE